MENEKCFICNVIQAKSSYYHMSCNHFYCPLCLTRVIILKHITQLKLNASVQVNCVCASNGLIALSIKDIGELAAKVIANDSKAKVKEPTCQLHYKEKLKMFCRDCLSLICSTCSKSENHYLHHIVTKEEILKVLRASIRDLPLQHRTTEQFSVGFEKAVETFKSAINSYLNEQLAQIDAIISQLTALKQEYIQMVKDKHAEWDCHLKVLKQLHVLYFESYETFEASNNFNELKFVNNLRNDFKTLKVRVNNQNNEQMIEMLESIKEMHGNAKDIFEVEVMYNELQKHYNICEKLLGHKGQIYSVIQLQDKRLCSGGDDYTIRFWERIEEKYKNTYTISEYTGEVVSLFQLNDRRILSCSKDNNAFRIWIDKGNSGKYVCAGTLSEHSFFVTSINQLTDGRLVTTSEDHSIKLWNTHQNLFQCYLTLKEHSQTVYSSIELSGKRLASASADCSIRIWEEVNGSYFSIHILRTQKKKIKALLLLKDGMLACGGKDGVLLFWKEHEEQFECIYTINSLESDIISLALLKDDRVVSLTKDGNVYLWEQTDTGWAQIEKLSVQRKQILCVIELTDGNILSTSNDRIVYLWKNTFFLD